MGTFNYKTSDYITLAIEPYCYYDFESDTEFMKEVTEQIENYGGTIPEVISTYIEECYSCDYENAKHIIDNFQSWLYHLSIEPGYYEGLQIDIEYNFIAFDSFEEKKDAQKEITRLKAVLQELAGCGFVACSPGWCTGYSNYSETFEKINEAVKIMREEVRTTPTLLWYERDQHAATW